MISPYILERWSSWELGSLKCSLIQRQMACLQVFVALLIYPVALLGKLCAYWGYVSESPMKLSVNRHSLASQQYSFHQLRRGAGVLSWPHG